MKRYLVVIFVLSLLIACGGAPAPTPDVVATQVAQAQAVAGTLTAAAPTATPTVESTPTPTSTDTATPTLTPSVTPQPTDTPLPLLLGDPMDYLPTEAEMPDGFSVNPSMSKALGDTPIPGHAVAYSRGFLELVGFVVIVAADEAEARELYADLSSDIRPDTETEVKVLGVDDHVSTMDDQVPAVQTYFRYRNVVGIVMAGGAAVADSELRHLSHMLKTVKIG